MPADPSIPPRRLCVAFGTLTEIKHDTSSAGTGYYRFAFRLDPPMVTHVCSPDPVEEAVPQSMFLFLADAHPPRLLARIAAGLWFTAPGHPYQPISPTRVPAEPDIATLAQFLQRSQELGTVRAPFLGREGWWPRGPFGGGETRWLWVWEVLTPIEFTRIRLEDLTAYTTWDALEGPRSQT